VSVPSILSRTARGAGWVIAWRLATRLLGLASTLTLVRLLAPGDFGLVALAAAFAMTLDVCLSLGVEDQIIRAERPTRQLYDTAFTVNLLRGAATAAIVALAAGPAAEFFGDPRLEDVLLALALSALFSGLANIGTADFRRELRFEREFAMQILPRVAGIVVTIGLAAWLHSHWALVGGIFVNRLGVVAMSYALHPFRPRLSLASWGDLAGISAWSWALGVAGVVKDRSESFVIGRVLGPAAIGHYTVGIEVASLAATELVDPICRACMPGFAASRREGSDGGAGDYLRILALLGMLTMPAGLGISLVAGPVVALGFGQAWLEAVPVIAVLGIASVLTPLGNLSGAMLTAHARLSWLLAVTVISAALRLGLLFLLTPWLGLTGAALAVGGAVVAEHMLMVALAFRLLRLRLARLATALWRPTLAAVAMAVLLREAGLGWAAPPDGSWIAAGQLAEGVALGVSSYTLSLFLLWSLAGRPAGAEADLLGLAGRLLRSRPSPHLPAA
jgi:O-antigen/teichoic acid export membrane protein